jgi:SAM-dependent methyltransferase
MLPAHGYCAHDIGDVPDIVEEICERYGVGPRFAAANLAGWCGSQGRRFERLAEILSLPDPLPLWFGYALSTNQRAETLYELLRPHLDTRAGRYLDVGSAYGGSLLAFARHGFEVRGVEIDPTLVELARANFADHALPDPVVEGSILDQAVVRQLGTFDVVTCIDVIEHVPDVPATLDNIVSMLRPGGVLLLEVPNKDSIGFVAKDGHFNLFGITQLRRPRAARYYRVFFDTNYGHMGEYHPLDSYLHRLEMLGCSARVIGSPAHVERELGSVGGLLRHDVWQSYKAFLRERARRLPAPLVLALHATVARYLLGLGVRWGLVRFARGDPALFRSRYLIDFWTVLARKR